MLRFDEVPFGQDRRALHDVAQLADVAGKRVVREQILRILIDSAHRLAVPGVELGQEVMREEGNVFLAIAQRRQLDRKHVQPVEQILPQLAGAHRFHRIHVRRGNDAHVHGLLLAPAQAAEGALLEHAQQFHLGPRNHLGDLVQENRSAVGELEYAGAPIVRAGERPLLVAENLALEQRFRNGRTVDRDKRKRRTGTELVNRLGDQLLAGAGLARNQDRGQRGGRLLDDAVDGANAGAVADDAAEGARFTQLAAQVPHFPQCVLALDRLPEQDVEPLRIDRFVQVIVGPFLDRLDRGLDGALGRQEDEGDVRQLIFECPQQLHAAGTRHDEIADDDRGTEAGDLAQPFVAVGCFLGLKSPGLDEFRQPLPGRVIVFDNQDPFACRLADGPSLFNGFLMTHIHPARLTLRR